MPVMFHRYIYLYFILFFVEKTFNLQNKKILIKTISLQKKYLCDHEKMFNSIKKKSFF